MLDLSRAAAAAAAGRQAGDAVGVGHVLVTVFTAAPGITSATSPKVGVGRNLTRLQTGDERSSAAPMTTRPTMAAHAPPPPLCTTALDCHLGGVCTPSGNCKCDSTWRGPTCQMLNVGPGTIAYRPPNRSSWGGGPPVYSPIDHKYHLYVSGTKPFMTLRLISAF